MARLALIEKQLCELNREIDTLINADKTSQGHREIVQSIPGLGSAAILTYLPAQLFWLSPVVQEFF